MTRKELVVRLLDRLIREHHPELVRFAFRLTKNLPAAEETTQEAYRRALSNWRSYDRQYAFIAWCMGIIRNLHVSRCRNRWTHVISLDRLVPRNGDGMVPLGHILPAVEIPILELMLKQEEKDVARKAYCSLASSQKAVVRLLADNGLMYRQVARKLNVPLGTVRSRLNRARQSAKVAYGGYL